METVIISTVVFIVGLVILLGIGRLYNFTRQELYELWDKLIDVHNDYKKIETYDIEYPNRDPISMNRSLHWLLAKAYPFGFTLEDDVSSDKIAYQIFELSKMPIVKHGKLVTGEVLYYFRDSEDAVKRAKRYTFLTVYNQIIQDESSFTISKPNGRNSKRNATNKPSRAEIPVQHNLPPRYRTGDDFSGWSSGNTRHPKSRGIQSQLDS